MKSQIPKEVTIAKSSKELKEMNCGDYKEHVCSYNIQQTRDDCTIQYIYGWCWPCRYEWVTLQLDYHGPKLLVAQVIFYLLDVRTLNALVLYKLAKGNDASKMLIVDFKEELVNAFVGQWQQIIGVPETLITRVAIKSNGQNQCAHCALYSKASWTRFRCSAPDCQLPLCSVGNGLVGQDCFSLCHGSEELHKAVLKKYDAMKKKVNERFR